MGYTPTEWKSGDTVTSTKLNKIENGLAAIASPYFIIENDPNNAWSTNCTWKEAIDTFNAGKILIYQTNLIRFCTQIDTQQMEIKFGEITLYATSENDYLLVPD